MADYYINPSAATNGTGTAASPYNTWVGVPLAAGNRYFQKRGTNYFGSFPSLTSGTAGNLTVVGAYANADGSDDTSQNKPLIHIGDAILPGTINSPKAFIRWQDINLQNARSVVESDKPIMWLGSNTEIVRCNLGTNLTALYGERVSNVLIDACTITACTSVGNVSMNAIVLTGGADMDNNRITSNNIKVGEGGNLTGHVIKCEPYTGFTQTNLLIKGNVIRPLNNQMSTFARRGISINNCTGGEIANNNVALFHAGFFASGVSKNVWIHHNSFNNNGAFGIHITTNTSSFLIEWNTCNQNGGNYAWANWYGRGIELSAGSELYKCHGHVVRFNKCNTNYNYGGPADNATEGVGIGLDDGTSACLVYGNIMQNNEGNGLQLYGGTTPPDDTGGHIICNNWFINNATDSLRNRRGGTRYRTDGSCHIGLGATRGSKTVIANNVFDGSFGGIRDNNLCSNLDIHSNVFQGQVSYAIATRGLTYRNETGGMYYDASGVLRKSLPGAQRYTYNPMNLAAQPVNLVEPAAKNLVLFSERFSDALWRKTSSIISENTTLALDGNVSADKLVESASTGGHYIYQPRTATNETTTFSVFAKAAERSWVYINMSNFSNASCGAHFNLATGAVVSLDVGNADYENPYAKIENHGSGWYRCIFTVTKKAVNQNNYPQISVARTNSPTSAALSYTGDGASGIFIWGAQLDAGAVATSYNPSTTSAATRAADLPEIHDNIYKPSLAKKVVNLNTDANGVPTPGTLSTGMSGDQVVDPKLDNKYQPTVGSPLLNVSSRKGIPWFMMPVPL